MKKLIIFISLLVLTGCSKQYIPTDTQKINPTTTYVTGYVASPNSLIETDATNIQRYGSKIITSISLPDSSRAQQGITKHTDGTFYMSENTVENNEFVSNIYQVDKDFTEVLKSFKIKRADFPLWSSTYTPHLGQIAFNYDDGMLYVPIMDTHTEPYKTALLRFDADLNYKGFIDTSSLSTYIDGIAFEGDYFWFDDWVLHRFKWDTLVDIEKMELLNTDQWEQTKFDCDHSLFSASQGIQIKNDKIYLVPECDPYSTRTKKGYTGISSYKISDLIPRPPVGETVINYPQYVHYFELPEDNKADHEAFSFINEEIIIISSADQGGKTLWLVDISIKE